MMRLGRLGVTTRALSSGSLGDSLNGICEANTSTSVIKQHDHDEARFRGAPDAVVFPTSTQQVVDIVKLCYERRVPVVPFGVGSGLEGGVCAVNGGVCLNTSKMKKILEVNSEDFDVRVQAGVTRKELNEHIKDTGLFFPIDPGADASLGGMASTSASGTNAVRYGTMQEAVINLEVVLADGSVIHTAGKSARPRKTSAAYNMTRLFVGSEGTLGVITEVALRVHAVPAHTAVLTSSFETLHGAVNTAIQTIQCGVPVARMELLDDVQVQAVNKRSGLGLPAQALLLLEFHDMSEAGIREQAEMVQELASSCGGTAAQWSMKEEERNKLWQARHDVWFANVAFRPGCYPVATDVAVPISHLADVVLSTKEDITRHGLVAPIVGHVGDGNFHLTVLVDPENSAEVAASHQVMDDMVERALAVGGTCTGEHGIGLGKMHHMEAQFGAEGVAAMWRIKQAFDPHCLMNPGKVLPS